MQALMIHMTNGVEYRKICGLHLDRMSVDFLLYFYRLYDIIC